MDNYIGRYECPVCHCRFLKLVNKRYHIKTAHPKKVKS